uniref:Uncharacterized protein n=1 Tax=Arundo donax TaxID=35708 RepID=A0A0A9A0K1_ARUDO
MDTKNFSEEPGEHVMSAEEARSVATRIENFKTVSSGIMIDI